MSATTDNMLELMTPVLIEFGKTVHICQIFESSLCLLMSLMAHGSSGGEDGAFQASWDFHSKKTLGALLNSLREKIEVSSEFDGFLDEGVKSRNKVIHGFLIHNAMRLADPKGRLEVEQELVVIRNEIKSRDVVVNKLIDAVLKQYGTSNERLKRNADRLWEHLNPETPSSGAH